MKPRSILSRLMLGAILCVAAASTTSCDAAIAVAEFIQRVFNCECACYCAETYLTQGEQRAGGSLRCVNKTRPDQTCGDVCFELSIGASAGQGLVACRSP